MSQRAPLSVAIITRGEPTLFAAVQSVSAHVEEVVIVHTNPEADEHERSWVAAYADRYEWYTGCLDEDGHMRDFADARRRSFALATCPSVMWIDSDDVVEHPERLREVVAALPDGRPAMVRLPYDYEFDESGRCKCTQPRERIVTPAHAFDWRHRVHEGLVPRVSGTALASTDVVRIRHTRSAAGGRASTARNLRILRRWVADEPESARARFYLALALFDAGDHGASEAAFVAYSERDPSNADELAIARLRMADLARERGDAMSALLFAHDALRARSWAECYAAIARAHHVLAEAGGGGAKEHWQEAVHYARAAWASPPTESELWVNPLDVKGWLHLTLSTALAHLGEVEPAIASAKSGLAVLPEEPTLRANLCMLEAEQAARRMADARTELGRLQLEARALLAAGTLHRPASDVIDRAAAAAGIRIPPPPGLDIVFACGRAWEQWDPRLVDERGAGGSEIAVCEMAKGLASRGHRVRVYGDPGSEGHYDGVEYLRHDKAGPDVTCDVLIAWRAADLLDVGRARTKWLWCHDTIWGGEMTDWRTRRVTRVLALSRFHQHELMGRIPLHRPTLAVRTRNGIDPARFAEPLAARDPHKVLYTSSPSRGLAQLLSFWPAVRERVPTATLDVYYGFEVWERMARELGDTQALATMAELQEKAAALEGKGVRLMGRANPRTLARAMLGAGIWVHPSWEGDHAFYETSCIGLMEARAAGLRCIVAPWGALLETAAGDAMQLDAEPTDDGYEADWSREIFWAATASHDEWWGPAAGPETVSAEARRDCAWAGVVEQWEAWMKEDIAVHDKEIESHTPATLAEPEQPLVLYAMLSPEASGQRAIDPHDPTGGSAGGGSRAGYMGLVRALGRRPDYRVVAFGPFAKPVEHVEGVEYVAYDSPEPYKTPDVMLAYYDVRALIGANGCLRIGSHHTYKPFEAWAWIDVNTAPSRHALEHLRRCWDPHGAWAELPNALEGVEDVRYAPVAGRVIYHTSPDRGADRLLECWPEIRRRVPHATLHVVGALHEVIDPYMSDAWACSYLGQRARRMKEAIAKAREAGGVRLLGRLPRNMLLEELAQASCFAWPAEVSQPCETWSTSLLECLAIGVPVVLAPVDALASIWTDHVYAVPSPAAEHLQEFIEGVCQVLLRPELAKDLSERGRKHAAQFTFDRSAQVLDGIVRTHLPLVRAAWPKAAE